MPKAQSLVLDTHVWLWFVTGNSNLSKGAIAEVTKAALAGRVLIPAICVWEVAMLEARKDYPE
jgi:PIN domain nuclease of toxin-antitoxin system